MKGRTSNDSVLEIDFKDVAEKFRDMATIKDKEFIVLLKEIMNINSNISSKIHVLYNAGGSNDTLIEKALTECSAIESALNKLENTIESRYEELNKYIKKIPDFTVIMHSIAQIMESGQKSKKNFKLFLKHIYYIDEVVQNTNQDLISTNNLNLDLFQAIEKLNNKIVQFIKLSPKILGVNKKILLELCTEMGSKIEQVQKVIKNRAEDANQYLGRFFRFDKLV